MPKKKHFCILSVYRKEEYNKNRHPYFIKRSKSEFSEIEIYTLNLLISMKK
jgi:hypothetical protein